MLANIVDRRANQYNVEVDVVFEPTWHDNSCENATKFLQDDDTFDVHDIPNTTVEDAIKFANTYEFPVTVYLYDKGADPCGMLDDGEDYVEDTTIITQESNAKR